MMFFTIRCDLPQNEHRVMREDLAMREKAEAGRVRGRPDARRVFRRACTVAGSSLSRVDAITLSTIP